MRHDLPFDDREDAARRLAEALSDLRGRHPLVLAIPRGALPMGRLIADSLDGDFDVVLVRKLGAPGNPELAIGAVEEGGWRLLNPEAQWLGADADYIDRAAARELARIRERRQRWTPGRAPIDPTGRIVIVVDDGLATGATMRAALHAVRARNPARLVCAVPVAPPEALARVEADADEVVCLATPPHFGSVGGWYRDFRQVEDAEVEALLRL